jgi:hypothetical protein
VTLTHASGVLELVMAIEALETDAVVETKFRLAAFVGHPVDAVVDIARLLSVCAAPNEVVWLEQYGPRAWMRGAIEQAEPVVPGWLAVMIEDLQVVQRKATSAVTVPADVNREFLDDLHLHAQLLRGLEVSGTWEEIILVPNDAAKNAELPFMNSELGAVVHERHVSLRLDDQEVPLGVVQTVMPSARVDGKIVDGKVRLVPGDSDTMIRRLVQRDDESQAS